MEEMGKKLKNKIKITKKHRLEYAIENIDFKGKRVFLRADLNVPIDFENNKIIDTFKIEAILPTIDALLASGAQIILATHIGKKEEFNLQNTCISTKILLDFFSNHAKKYNIIFEPEINNLTREKIKETAPNGEKTTSFINKKNYDAKIILIENLRCFEGEKEEAVAKKFAKKLKKTSDFYVNEAFGTIYRDDTSITILPKLFKKKQIFVGLQFELEIKMLSKLLKRKKDKFSIIIGGGKVESKLPLIEKILDNSDGVKIENLLLCPAIDFPFMKYYDDEIGKSIFNKDMIPYASRIIEKAHAKGVHIFYPEDFIAAKDNFYGDSYDIDKPEIPHDFIGISIGPKTAKNYAQIIRDSKTVFFNGLSGNIKKVDTLDGMKKIFKAMQKRNLFSVIGGGESVACARMFDLERVKHLSTGGGAALAVLANAQLPGLEPFVATKRKKSTKI